VATVAKRLKEPTFEEAMAELDTIVLQLETGDTPLEESIEAFEKGVGLVRRLHERLDTVERKIEELVAGGGGEPEPSSVGES
jgi:exodeoxyribonuclease VII small subunit